MAMQGIAARNGHLDVVKHLVDKRGAAIDAAVDNGDTASTTRLSKQPSVSARALK